MAFIEESDWDSWQKRKREEAAERKRKEDEAAAWQAAQRGTSAPISREDVAGQIKQAAASDWRTGPAMPSLQTPPPVPQGPPDEDMPIVNKKQQLRDELYQTVREGTQDIGGKIGETLRSVQEPALEGLTRLGMREPLDDPATMRQAWQEREEPFPGYKGGIELLTDPGNLIPGSTIGRAGRAVKEVAELGLAGRALKGAKAAVTAPELQRFVPAAPIEDVGKVKNVGEAIEGVGGIAPSPTAGSVTEALEDVSAPVMPRAASPVDEAGGVGAASAPPLKPPEPPTAQAAMPGPEPAGIGNIRPSKSLVSDTPGTQKIFDMYYGKQPVSSESWWNRVKNGYTAMVRTSTDNKVDLARVQEMGAKAAGRPLNPDEMLRLLTSVNPDKATRIRLDEGLAPALQSVSDDLPWLSAFMTARHDKDIATAFGNAKRKFSGNRSLADIQATLDNMPTEIGAERFTKVEQAANQIDAFVQMERQRLLDSGVWSPELFNDLSQRYPHYVPTKILDYMKEPGQLPVGRSISLKDKGLRELTEEGTERLREDPLASVVRLAYETEARVAKNNQFNAFMKLRDLSPELQTKVREVRASYTPTNKETIIEGFVDGKRVRLAAPRALNLVSNAESRLVLPVYSTLMNAFRAVTTARNPLFLLSNAMLDAATFALRAPIREAGPLNIRSGKSIARSVAAPLYLPRVMWELGKAYIDAFKGLKEGRYAGPRTAQYLREGGGMFGYFGGSTEHAKATVEQLARRNVLEIKNKGDVLRLTKDIALFEPVEAVGERIELAPRVAQTQLALKRGKSAVEAVNEGRTVTIDFQTGGNFSKWLNSFVPFFNVGVQAVVQPVRAFKENPIAFASTTATLLGGPLLMAEAWNRSDPQRAADYEDVPQSDKDQGIVFMLPTEAPVDARGDRRPQYALWRWRDFAPLGIVAREAIVRGMGDDPRDWKDLVLRSGMAVSPIQAGTAAEAVGSVMPLGLQTAAQLTNDRDWFRDQKITTEYRDEKASALSKGIAEVTDMRPSQVEFGLRDLSGGVGNMALAASDLATGRERGDMPQEVPVLGGIYGRFVKGNIGQQLDRARDEAYPDELKKSLSDAGVDITISPVKGVVDGMRLTLAEQAQYQQLANYYTKEALDMLMTRGSWELATADEREKKVRAEVGKARDKAGKEILRNMSATERQMRKAG